MSDPAALTVDDIASYLQVGGWHREIGGAVAEVWRINGAGGEILLPLRTEAPDYSGRVKFMIDDLARIERRDQAQIVDDISRQFLDVTNLRAVDHDNSPDSIALQAGYELFLSARQMVVAAAGATIRRQGHFGRSMPHDARRHARKVRLGHTRRGSYVVPILSQARIPSVAPTAEDMLTLDVAAEERLFDRRVVVTLSRALTTLKDLVGDDGSRMASNSDINDAVQDGISRELCQAVYHVLEAESIEEMSVGFQWAPGASPPTAVATQPVEFQADAKSSLRRVAEALKHLNRPKHQVIFGKVFKMWSEDNEPGGSVEVDAAIDGRVRPVVMRLNSEHYRIALACHKRRPVVVHGLLDLSPGQQATMVVTHFEADESMLLQVPNT